MSSCFLCDTSYVMGDRDVHYVYVSEGRNKSFYMKFMPIMVGSTGTGRNDQQHENNNNQNYVSYRVKRIEFRSSVYQSGSINLDSLSTYDSSYILIFKVPFRNPVFDYYFGNMQNFMLYSEPESVLKYGVYGCRRFSKNNETKRVRVPDKYDLIVDKPFIVGPNDYVGVLYMFNLACKIDSSAKVFFDVV